MVCEDEPLETLEELVSGKHFFCFLKKLCAELTWVICPDGQSYSNNDQYELLQYIQNQEKNLAILKSFYENTLHKQFDSQYIDVYDLVTEADEQQILKFYMLLLTASVSADSTKEQFATQVLELSEDMQG